MKMKKGNMSKLGKGYQTLKFLVIWPF